MPNPIIDSTSPLRILITKRFAAKLKAALDIPHVLTTFAEETPEEIASLLTQTDVFVTSIFKAGWLPDGPIPLRLIHLFGAGTDGIDFSAIPPGCTVCNVYGHERGIAEYVFMMMAVLNRDLFTDDAALRQGYWSDRSDRRELHGRNLFIVGLGRIGGKVARWGHFVGMHVSGVTRLPSPERAQSLGLDAIGGSDELDAYLPQADFVVVTVPDTPETRGIIGEAQFRQMKSTAYLINVARGPVIDESALYYALRDKTIAGAAIDVWYHYPPVIGQHTMPSQYPIHELKNVIMTPHNSGMTDATMAYRWGFLAKNLRRLTTGEALENVVWPQSETRENS